MMRSISATIVISVVLAGVVSFSHAYPKPSPYPVSWQLKFEHSMPKRIVVTPSGSKVAEAYWYIRYTVTNPGKDEQRFLPVFELMTDNGDVIRSDNDIPDSVLAEIRIREKNRDLLTVNQIAGPLRVGVDQARDGVAVWQEPMIEMGRFRIFVAGLSGEAQIFKDDKGVEVQKTTADGKKEPVVLWKTFMMEYLMLSGGVRPGNDPLELVTEEWLMR
ncbi:MAG: hypothetical protein ABSH20_16410 [Tepidisphaeraceae bacterium]|jgi:hypothetical protein